METIRNQLVNPVKLGKTLKNRTKAAGVPKKQPMKPPTVIVSTVKVLITVNSDW